MGHCSDQLMPHYAKPPHCLFTRQSITFEALCVGSDSLPMRNGSIGTFALVNKQFGVLLKSYRICTSKRIKGEKLCHCEPRRINSCTGTATDIEARERNVRNPSRQLFWLAIQIASIRRADNTMGKKNIIQMGNVL